MPSVAPIPFAVAPDGSLVAADDPGVRRGLACRCRCPQCHEAVVARQGNVRAWGFAHQGRSFCPGAYESSLHLAVKEVLAATRRLFVPKCIVRRHHQPISHAFEYCRTSPGEAIRDFEKHFPLDGIGETAERMINFDAIQLEQTDEDMRPDVVGQVGEDLLYIEVAVTHFVDEEKCLKLRRRYIPTIELDLSHKHNAPWTWNELRHYLTEDLEWKDWLLHPGAEAAANLHYKRQRLAYDEWKRTLEGAGGSAGRDEHRIGPGAEQSGPYIRQLRMAARAGKQLSKSEVDALIATLWR